MSPEENASSVRRRLPIGIQNFREIKEEGHYYVDKTSYIDRLLNDGKHFFLSRPRRFGKSLFLDTLKEFFEGNECLFKDLWIHKRQDWSQNYPVVRLSFGSGHFGTHEGLQTSLKAQLERVERESGVESVSVAPMEKFGELIHRLHEASGKRTVVLIDEYDKPILDAIDAPDVARLNRDYLRGLYSVVKDFDAHIQFSFITGVSKFSKVSLFSGLNNLTDITMDPQYSAICGYTELDLDSVFSPELPGLDRSKIRDWYNGYSWQGKEKVYNPYDILFLFRNREYQAYWFETGTPTFLVETLFKQQINAVTLDGMIASDELLSSFDVGRIGPEALLFQTGYLTLMQTERRAGETFYRLGYPNREVQQGLNRSLLSHMVGDEATRAAQSAKLYDLLQADDMKALHELFHAFYSSIPYEWFTNNDIANYEGYYASVFYSYFAGLGLDVTVEDSTNRGRLDMALRFEDRIYIFELKVVEQAGEGAAMAQLKDRNYADKYRDGKTKVCLVAVEFSSESRNIESFEVERL